MPFNLFDPISWGVNLGFKTGTSAGQAIASGKDPIQAGADTASTEINALKDTGLYFAKSVTSIPAKVGEAVTGTAKALGGFVSGTLTKSIIILILILIGLMLVNKVIEKGVA